MESSTLFTLVLALKNIGGNVLYLDLSILNQELLFYNKMRLEPRIVVF